MVILFLMSIHYLNGFMGARNGRITWKYRLKLCCAGDLLRDGKKRINLQGWTLRPLKDGLVWEGLGLNLLHGEKVRRIRNRDRC